MPGVRVHTRGTTNRWIFEITAASISVGTKMVGAWIVAMMSTSDRSRRALFATCMGDHFRVLHIACHDARQAPTCAALLSDTLFGADLGWLAKPRWSICLSSDAFHSITRSNHTLSKLKIDLAAYTYQMTAFTQKNTNGLANTFGAQRRRACPIAFPAARFGTKDSARQQG